MSPQHEGSELLTKVESAVRNALNEIQRGSILCVPPSLVKQQVEGAARIVMRHLAQECPELAMGSTEPSQSESIS
jgi:hypothetical protein